MYKTDKLKSLRLKKGWTVYDMAKRLGISPSHYCLLENKQRKLYYDMAIKIASVFKMKPDRLFLTEDKKQTEKDSTN